MYFRTVPRALTTSARSVSSLTSSTTTKRAYHLSNSTIGCLYARQSQGTKSGVFQQQSIRSASQHAIANPELAGIEKRWEAMPPEEQAELWMKLRDRMKVDWHDMTVQEKKAAYWIAFGPHGPRAEAPKGEGLRIFIDVSKYVAISLIVFLTIRYFAGPAPHTMTKEWQEASNEYAKKERMDPITGISSEGYTGRGHVQSPPANKQ